MKHLKLWVLTFVVSLSIWALFTWPLPRYAASGIPMAHAGAESDPVRFMEPGDHLQLLYYFWVFSDMILGETPWMYNPYEFHTGNEEARYEPHSYYAPYSWAFTLVAALGGTRALAYNLSAFLSIWLTLLFTWQLVRRYARSDTLAMIASIMSIALPYRWFALLGGSPTGFGMTWIPLAFWGCDVAIREERLRGGVAAALAVVFAYMSDAHVFFFLVLSLPAMSLFALLARSSFTASDWRAYVPLVKALWPAALTSVLTVIYSRVRSFDLADTNMAAGRTWEEVIGASPSMRGFLSWPEHHLNSQIYLGYVFVILVGLSLILALRQYRHSRDQDSQRAVLLMLALAAATCVIALLAVGPHGPLGGFALRVVRRVISPYTMIRQTGKIFALMPTLLALWAALSLSRLPCKWHPRWHITIAGAVTVLMLAEYQRRMDPPISLLTNEQAAYAAVAADAHERGVVPHAIIITLWPGDSHFASQYQFYSSLYRIRMINGYTPAVDSVYFNEIFLPFQTMNQGWMTDEQANDLLSRGIEYLIVHADLFPEKVSPFPILFTLRHLAEHPRLTYLKQDGPIWAYRIEERDSATSPAALNWTQPLFPARHWHFVQDEAKPGETNEDITASRGEYLRISQLGAHIRAAETHSSPATAMRWLFRARGQAILHARSSVNAQEVYSAQIEIDHPEWHWLEVSMPSNDHANLALDFELLEGHADLCSALLTAGAELRSGQPIPAAYHFHAGFLDPTTDKVHLRAGKDRRGPVFYGPKLPIGRGRVTAHLHFSSPADVGTALGEIEVEQIFSPVESVSAPVIAGESATVTIDLAENLPVNLIFHFAGEADIALESVTWEWPSE